jgi:hypothetical protein
MDGHDGEALRQLAGIDGRGPHAVNDLVPSAMAALATATEEMRSPPAGGADGNVDGNTGRRTWMIAGPQRKGYLIIRSRSN